MPTLSSWRGDMSSAGAPPAPASVHRVIAGQGVPLDAGVRLAMERRFQHDFSRVRIHADAEAARSARDIQARAWTVGHHIAFADGRYHPQSTRGQRLLAHELAHVVQQSEASRRAYSSFGTEGGQARATAEGRSLSLRISEGQQELPLQRETDAGPELDAGSGPGATTDVDAGRDATPPPPVEGTPADAGVAPAQATPPTPAVPTLTVGPTATLTRGDALTADIGFRPNAGETLLVTAWRFATPAHGTVTRASAEADFQRRWQGTMALTGTLAVDYTVTPAGGTPSATATLTRAITVNDRTGATWSATADLRAEGPLSGQPDPPQVFSQLGRHNLTITSPVATATAISAGPNTGFSFVGSLAAGTYVSQPGIHPALNNATSRFRTFHSVPSRLYLIVGAARTLIPITEYSGLSVAGGLTFTVPDWEAFYKAHNFFTVTATSGAAGPVTLRAAWWGLASNAQDADLAIRDAAAIRRALHIAATDAFDLSATPRGSWEGFQLMQGAAILAGTQSHEYAHAVHSHRANFTAMLRAVDPQRKIEQTVSTPTSTVTFSTEITNWVAEIRKPNHELVDEAASRTAGAFVAVAGREMAGVNTDPSSGAFLGSVWNITADQQMTN